MSESVKPSSTIDETMSKFDAYIGHLKEHVTEVPVKTKKYDPNCWCCQVELKRIHKRSDNLPVVELSDKAQATVSFTSLLCHLQMHTECVQYYCMKSELIEFRCTCSCHNRPTKSTRIPRVRSRVIRKKGNTLRV